MYWVNDSRKHRRSRTKLKQWKEGKAERRASEHGLLGNCTVFLNSVYRKKVWVLVITVKRKLWCLSPNSVSHLVLSVKCNQESVCSQDIQTKLCRQQRLLAEHDHQSERLSPENRSFLQGQFERKGFGLTNIICSLAVPNGLDDFSPIKG